MTADQRLQGENMDIRQAILATADLFDRNPELWNFDIVDVPACGTPGCAAGYIGYFMGWKVGDPICRLGSPVGPLGIDNGIFYQRMPEWAPLVDSNAQQVASGLRRYADRYHPSSVKTPDWEALSRPAAGQFVFA